MKKLILLLFIVFIIGGGLVVFKFSNTESAEDIKAHYNSYVSVNKDSYIYDKNKKKIGKIYDEISIALDKYDNPNLFKKLLRRFYRLFNKDDYQYGVDGEIVGTGDSDFTKQYTEYELSLNGKKFTLIDVPGIEGKESDYTEIIKGALLKAHCVFYVQGKNKQPDEATADKIKDYLNEWVSVYSIYNVRSNAEKYIDAEDRVDLRTNDVRQVESLIQDTFYRKLGRNFKGTLCTQGLLSLCSLARFAKPHRKKYRFNKEKDTLNLHIFEKQKGLIKKQKKLLDLFGSKEKVYEFSRFDDLEKVVDNMSDHYLDEIIESRKDNHKKK